MLQMSSLQQNGLSMQLLKEKQDIFERKKSPSIV